MEQHFVVSGQELIRVARLTSPVGIRGSVKVTPFFLNIEELSELLSLCSDDIYLCFENAFPKRVHITFSRNSKNALVLKFKELNTRSEAVENVGKDIVVDYKKYYNYLSNTGNVLCYLNYSIVDINLGYLGSVVDIIRQGQILMVVDDGREKRLVPFAQQLIDRIEHDKKCIKTLLPEGIFE